MDFIQPNCPTNDERYRMVKMALEVNNRLEDFDNIIQLLSPPSDILSIVPYGSCKNIKVAILGAGLAGLSAAFELRKAGFNVTIFEAEDKRIGGRVYTHYFDRSKQLYGELGPMRMSASHETTWHYINLFNLKTRPFIQDNPNAFRYVQGVRVKNTPQEIQENIYPKFDMTLEERLKLWPQLFNQAFEAYLLSMTPEVRKEILQIKSEYSPEIIKADYLSILQRMELAGLSNGAIEMLSGIEPFVADFLSNSFFEILHELYPVSFAYTYEIIGGFLRLPKAFLTSLFSREPKEYMGKIPASKLGTIQILSGHQVIGLSQPKKNGSVIVHHKNIKRNTIYDNQYDFIICAVPFSNLRLFKLNPVFNSSKMQAIRVLNYSASQKTVFLCNYRFWEASKPKNNKIVGGGSFTDLVINSIWYPSTPAQSPSCPGVITASYNWTQDAVRLGNFNSSREIELIKRQIEEVHGLPMNSLDSIVTDYKTIVWNNNPWSLGAFAFYDPQQKVLFSKVAIEPEYNRRVFFAGEHVSVTRAWMQGSLKTGMMAANDIARECQNYI
ncbi:NAD(P)-binding protein [Alkaliphilus pronyensis]|uniref:NAD(P)-binding protein n=1 Tax=Alkaliphilus pronyensis TaxID=1482732 RepID=A0A6I0FKG7_9FIRM|nr:FAD-dependent oxidoreductase [Alkaliphilus pronyensis]KAB3538623.1 NAD(P)-binding protein [Alkaliphilus pronyensis]